MKLVILAGGLGTRLSEETELRPKPMVEIGGRPILWHIMKIYSAAGVNDFIVCLGYKGYIVKEYFLNYFLHSTDVTIDVSKNTIEYHHSRAEPWRVTLVDTGAETMTGGRIRRVAEHLDGAPFCMTYGDGVSNVDIKKLIAFHAAHGREATVTAVRPPGRFGALERKGDAVEAFVEKPHGDGSWINGGFFVLNASALQRIDGDASVFERGPLEAMAHENQLRAFEHEGFWRPMDTLRDRRELEELWAGGHAPWKTW